MYCPKCLNNTLEISNTGVIQVIVNGLKKDSSKFAFNLIKDSKEDLKEHICECLEDTIKWYSSFSNQAPISSVQLLTGNVFCENHCSIANQEVDVVGVIITKLALFKLVNEIAKKYGVKVIRV